jgi:hypothetical protein
MSAFNLIAAAVILAGPVTPDSKPGASQIECVNEHAAAADAEAVWIVRRDRRAPTEDESAAMDRFSEAARGCAEQFGWNQTRTVTAITYALGQVIYDSAVRDLAARGIAPGFLDHVWAELGERGRTAIATHDMADGNPEFIGGVVARSLSEFHAPIRSGTPEFVDVGHIVGRGIAARIGRDQALRDFDMP